MNGKSVLFGSVVAVLAAASLAVGTALATDPGDITIATQALHKTLVLGDVAADNAIGVVYQRGAYSFLRWSTDGGQTFNAEWPLREGRPAKSPRLAACGDWLYATSQWRTTSSGVPHLTVEFVNVTDPQSTAGRFRFVDLYGADIACHGDVIALTYSTSNGVFFAVMDGQCGQPCTPAFTTMVAPYSDSSARVAAVDDGYVVTWPPGQGLAVQHFAVSGTGTSVAVVADPVVTLMPGIGVFSPVIAGDGARVVVVYTRRNDTHMRISDDYGQTFGPRIIVKSISIDPCCGGSAPDSVDARDGRILVTFGAGGGDPPGIGMVGRFTKNDGATWRTTTGHGGGTQMGVLLNGVAAEAWDSHYYADRIYGNVPQEIDFRTTAVP